MSIRAVVVPLVVALSACHGGDSSGGGGDGGLSPTGDATIDAPVDAPVDAPLDAPTVCPVTVDEVMTDPLLTGVGTATYTGFLICPANDTDRLRVEMPDSGNLEVLIESDPLEATVTAEVLNNSFTPIVVAAPVAAMPLVHRAYLPNQQHGPMYINTYSPAPSTGIGHYKITVTINTP